MGHLAEHRPPERLRLGVGGDALRLPLADLTDDGLGVGIGLPLRARVRLRSLLDRHVLSRMNHQPEHLGDGCGGIGLAPARQVPCLSEFL